MISTNDFIKKSCFTCLNNFYKPNIFCEDCVDYCNWESVNSRDTNDNLESFNEPRFIKKDKR